MVVDRPKTFSGHTCIIVLLILQNLYVTRAYCIAPEGRIGKCGNVFRRPFLWRTISRIRILTEKAVILNLIISSHCGLFEA